MTITDIYEKFPTHADCIRYLEEIRWNRTPVCPYCKVEYFTPLAKENRYHCNNCNTSFSVTVNTIFHRSRLPLQKWFLGICLVLNSSKRISTRQLSKQIEVNKDTACSIIQKIRKAMLSNRDLLLTIAENKTFKNVVGG